MCDRRIARKMGAPGADLAREAHRDECGDRSRGRRPRVEESTADNRTGARTAERGSAEAFPWIPRHAIVSSPRGEGPWSCARPPHRDESLDSGTPDGEVWKYQSTKSIPLLADVARLQREASTGRSEIKDRRQSVTSRGGSLSDQLHLVRFGDVAGTQHVSTNRQYRGPVRGGDPAACRSRRL